jgi:16S rRNA (guanine966-N2)-methyltransferase
MRPPKKRVPAVSIPPAGGRLRIIGGRLRGRQIAYSGDARTRPMKDRIREAVFNLLGVSLVGKLAVDLFAGTGALGLEALSRGAAAAVFVERHFPTAQLIRDNVRQLQLEPQSTIVAADTFFWAAHDWQPGTVPLVVFCSPPFDLYRQQSDDMLQLIGRFASAAPRHSTLVIEAAEDFETSRLPAGLDWDIRRYAPAQVAIADLLP